MSQVSFDLSCVYHAALAAANAEDTFDVLTSEMILWNASEAYPTNADVAAEFIRAGRTAGTAKVYASRLLKWAKSGKTPRSMHAAVTQDPPGSAKGKGGRKAGQGAGKTTKVKVDAAQAAPATVPNEDKAWKTFIETMRAQVPGRKDWQSDDIVAFQDCASKMLALLTRNSK